MDTTRSRRQALLALLATVAFEAVAVAALVALGRSPSARIDTADLGRWLDTTPLVDVSFALLRIVALLLVSYLLVTTVAYVAARLTRIPTLVRAVAPLTLPAVRRVADRAVAGTLVTATLVGGVPLAATAQEAAPPTVATVTASGAILPPGVRAPTQTAAEDAIDQGSSRSVPIPTPQSARGPGAGGTTDAAPPSVPIPTPRSEVTTSVEQSEASTPPRAPVPTPRTAAEPEPSSEAPTNSDGAAVPMPGLPVPRPAPDARDPEDRPLADPPATDASSPARRVDAPRPGGPSPLADPATTAGEWVASRGDSLWHIAEHVVAEATGRTVADVPDHDVAAYWHALVAANRGSVASGDVDVVAIGERIVLPPLDAN